MGNADSLSSLEDVVAAVQDLTRVMIAINGNFESKSEAIRKLYDLSIPANRIAAILAMEVKDVSSAIAKHKKKSQRTNGAVEKTSNPSPSTEEPISA